MWIKNTKAKKSGQKRNPIYKNTFSLKNEICSCIKELAASCIDTSRSIYVLDHCKHRV